MKPHLTLAEVEERFGSECLALFDYQCADIAAAPDFRFYDAFPSRLFASARQLDERRAAIVRASWKTKWPYDHPVSVHAKWDPAMGIWIRYTCGVSSYPRRPVSEAPRV